MSKKIWLPMILLLTSFAGAVAAGTGTSEAPFVGSVRSDRATGGFRAFLEIRDGSRALKVVEVTVDGPAERAGLKTGDLIIALDGKPLPSWNNDLERVKSIDRLYSAGDLMVLSVERRSAENGPKAEPSRQDIELQLDAMPIETQEELLHWVKIAEQRLAEGDALYCHDVRPSASGSHFVCHDDSAKAEAKP